MGLFSAHYDRPGPGISKDEKPKPPFIHFFELYTRKFWLLVRMNLLYFVCCIVFYLPVILTTVALVHINENPFNIGLFYLSTLPILLTGPFTAGYMLVQRNFAREIPTFLWSDFKDAVKTNWKQSMVASAIGVVVFDVLLFVIHFYFANLSKQSFYVVPLVLSLLLVLIFLFMQYYLYILIVTFNLKLKNIYRNALIFAFLGAPRNFLITVCIAAIVVLTSLFQFLVILIPLVTLSTAAFLISFCAWPVIQKYMIDPYPELSQKGDEEPEDNSVFLDRGREKK